MATLQDVYGHVFKITGPLDAICACEPPGANGRSGLPWYHSLLNLLGIVKVARAEAAVFIGLSEGALVYVAFDDDGKSVAHQTMPLAAISGASAKARDEWTTDIAFDFDGTRRTFAVCGFVFGMQTPPELIPVLKQQADTIVRNLVTRT